MECTPAVRAEVVKEATPLDRAANPSGVVPSRNVTWPVGVPAIELIVIVRVTAFEYTAGFALDVTLAADMAVPISSVPLAEPVWFVSLIVPTTA
jgi:hypothetical protein